jgi:enamine deaminase RidA (YjgF/YER057c/UK114 family)
MTEPDIRFINPEGLAPPPGYSNVVDVRRGSIVFVAGQTATDRHGKLVGGDSLEAQADQAFRNVGVALAAVGLGPRNLVKLTVFVRDMGALAAYRRARDRFFASVSPLPAPAITLVEVSKLFAPEFLIEIEAVAAG